MNIKEKIEKIEISEDLVSHHLDHRLANPKTGGFWESQLTDIALYLLKRVNELEKEINKLRSETHG